MFLHRSSLVAVQSDRLPSADGPVIRAVLDPATDDLVLFTRGGSAFFARCNVAVDAATPDRKASDDADSASSASPVAAFGVDSLVLRTGKALTAAKRVVSRVPNRTGGLVAACHDDRAVVFYNAPLHADPPRLAAVVGRYQCEINSWRFREPFYPIQAIEWVPSGRSYGAQDAPLMLVVSSVALEVLQVFPQAGAGTAVRKLHRFTTRTNFCTFNYACPRGGLSLISVNESRRGVLKFFAVASVVDAVQLEVARPSPGSVGGSGAGSATSPTTAGANAAPGGAPDVGVAARPEPQVQHVLELQIDVEATADTEWHLREMHPGGARHVVQTGAVQPLAIRLCTIYGDEYAAVLTRKEIVLYRADHDSTLAASGGTGGPNASETAPMRALSTVGSVPGVALSTFLQPQLGTTGGLGSSTHASLRAFTLQLPVDAPRVTLFVMDSRVIAQSVHAPFTTYVFDTAEDRSPQEFAQREFGAWRQRLASRGASSGLLLANGGAAAATLASQSTGRAESSGSAAGAAASGTTQRKWWNVSVPTRSVGSADAYTTLTPTTTTLPLLPVTDRSRASSEMSAASAAASATTATAPGAPTQGVLVQCSEPVVLSYRTEASGSAGKGADVAAITHISVSLVGWRPREEGSTASAAARGGICGLERAAFAVGDALQRRTPLARLHLLLDEVVSALLLRSSVGTIAVSRSGMRADGRWSMDVAADTAGPRFSAPTWAVGRLGLREVLAEESQGLGLARPSASSRTAKSAAKGVLEHCSWWPYVAPEHTLLRRGVFPHPVLLSSFPEVAAAAAPALAPVPLAPFQEMLARIFQREAQSACAVADDASADALRYIRGAALECLRALRCLAHPMLQAVFARAFVEGGPAVADVWGLLQVVSFQYMGESPELARLLIQAGCEHRVRQAVQAGLDMLGRLGRVEELALQVLELGDVLLALRLAVEHNLVSVAGAVVRRASSLDDAAAAREKGDARRGPAHKRKLLVLVLETLKASRLPAFSPMLAEVTA